jgi:hypothetical protein
MNSKLDSQDGAEEAEKGASRENHHQLEHSEELMCNELLPDDFEIMHSNTTLNSGANQGLLLSHSDPKSALSHSDPYPVYKRTGENIGYAEHRPTNQGKQISSSVSLYLLFLFRDLRIDLIKNLYRRKN